MKTVVEKILGNVYVYEVSEIDFIELNSMREEMHIPLVLESDLQEENLLNYPSDCMIVIDGRVKE